MAIAVSGSHQLNISAFTTQGCRTNDLIVNNTVNALCLLQMRTRGCKTKVAASSNQLAAAKHDMDKNHEITLYLYITIVYMNVYI